MSVIYKGKTVAVKPSEASKEKYKKQPHVQRGTMVPRRGIRVAASVRVIAPRLTRHQAHPPGAPHRLVLLLLLLLLLPPVAAACVAASASCFIGILNYFPCCTR